MSTTITLEGPEIEGIIARRIWVLDDGCGGTGAVDGDAGGGGNDEGADCFTYKVKLWFLLNFT